MTMIVQRIAGGGWMNAPTHSEVNCGDGCSHRLLAVGPRCAVWSISVRAISDCAVDDCGGDCAVDCAMVDG